MTRAWFHWGSGIYWAIRPPRLDGAEGDWTMACPRCGDGIPCNGTPRDELAVGHYRVSVRGDGALTLSPSVICPRCRWHVVITEGVAS